MVNYVDTFKQAIIDQDSELTSKLKKYLENNKTLFEGDDKKTFEKEISTTENLWKLLKNGVKEEKYYWVGK